MLLCGALLLWAQFALPAPAAASVGLLELAARLRQIRSVVKTCVCFG